MGKSARESVLMLLGDVTMRGVWAAAEAMLVMWLTDAGSGEGGRLSPGGWAEPCVVALTVDRAHADKCVHSYKKQERKEEEERKEKKKES